MNKFDMELNENKAKAFFVRHGEKLGLAVAAGLLGTFSYLGFGLKPDLQGRSPSTLENTIVSAENHIKSGRWDDLRPQRLAITNTVDRLDSNKVRVAASDYVFDYLLARRSATAPLRSDPNVLPVFAPETHLGRMSIADTATTAHPLSMLDDVNLESESADTERGPGSIDTNSKATSAAKVDLGAAIAATGLDPVKAGLGDLPNAAPVDRYVATVKFLFPYKEMYTNFRATFRNSVGYDATNDRFLIRYMEIQRRVNGGEWVDYTNQIREEEKTFVVSAPEPFDAKFAMRGLTRPFPPVLLKDYYGVSRHSRIPEAALPETTLADSAAGAGAGDSRRSGSSGMSGRSGMSGPPGGMSGMSGPPGGMSGMSGPPGGMSGMSGMSGRSGPPGTGGSAGMAAMVEEEPTEMVDYKLVRFSDPTVEPGNSYEYRARYWIFDPNNPVKMEGYIAAEKKRTATAMTTSASESDGQRPETEEESGEEMDDVVLQSNVKLDQLSPEVRERLTLEAGLARPNPTLKNCRPSPWSDATSPLRVASVVGDVFVSTANIPTPAKSTVADKEVSFQLREGALRAVAAIWDSTFGIQVPLVLENVYPGSVLGGTSTTRVLDPITRTYKKLENNDGSYVTARGGGPGYKGSSGMVLVDFLGGKDIVGGTESKTKFKVPTEALLLDSTGQLLVKSASSDARDWTWLSGEVLREDGLLDKLEEATETEDSESGGRSGRSGGQSGRSGFPGGGGPPGGGKSGGGNSGRSGPPGGGGFPGGGRPPGGGGNTGRSGPPGGR